MQKELDLYDKKILYHLDIDSRESATSISKKIRLPKETVNYRIQRLIEKNYIKKFYVIINASKLGYNYYKIYFKFSKFTKDREKEVLKFLTNEKCCSHVRIIDGVYDLSVILMKKSAMDVRVFLQKFSSLFGEFLLEKNIHTIITTHKLNQKIFYQEETVRRSIYHGIPVEYVLDELDTGIIKNISTNARIKLIDLAKKLNEDPRLIRYHLKKLEKEGIIFCYSIALNGQQLSYETVQIDIKVKNLQMVRNMIEYFDSTNTCIFAYETTGVYDITLTLHVESDEQLRDIMEKFKEKFMEHYIDYELSSIYEEILINFSPFLTMKQEETIKKKENQMITE
jgi:Lrp/AsnC family transcriptional regulator, leucine-responsive regulatory protein